MVNTDRVLVTISMMTYNQEKYVRESLRGMLAQTYDPLQIVISDDNSTDGTWDIIKEEVDEYKRLGGEHQIFLNRNASNLGIAKHFEKLVSLCNGVLMVCNAGDDISFPNRVETIVDEWLKSEKRATIIVNGAVNIDMNGNVVGEMPNRILKAGVFGAGATYASFLAKIFGPIVEPLAYEDQVSYRRARIFGDLLVIKKPLMYYRVGSGVSTFATDFRARMAKCVHAEVASLRQIIRDVRHARSEIPSDKYAEIYKQAVVEYCQKKRELNLWTSHSFFRRLNGLCAVSLSKFLGPSGLVAIVLLLPQTLSSRILDMVFSMSVRFKRLLYKCCRV